MLNAEPLVPGASPGGLDFVRNEIAAILLDDAEGHLEIFLRRSDETTDALDRLGKKCGNAPRGRELNYVFNILHASDFAFGILEPQRAAIAVRIHRVDDSDLDGRSPPGIHSRKPASKGGTAAVSMAQCDDFKVSSVHARNLNRRLVRLGAAVREIRFLERAGSNLRQLFRQRNHRLIRKACGNVLQPVDLCLRTGDDARIAMTYADGDDPAEEIKVPFAIYIPHVLHERVIHGNGIGVVRGNRRKNEFLLFLIDFVVVAGVMDLT